MPRLATLVVLVAVTGAAHAQDVAPVTFFGQEAPTTATYTLSPTGGAVTARNSFLAALDPSSVETFDFDSLTPVVTDATPPRVDPGTLDEDVVGEFGGYGSDDVIPFRLYGRNGSVIRNQTRTDLFGTWATSGNQYLFAQAFDGSRPSVTDATPDGTTQVALRIQYDPSLATGSSTAKPFSAFGAYITDTEGYATIRLTLTPLGGATPTNPLVVLDFGPVTNQGAINAMPGHAQTSFVGFTDFDSQYETIEIQFTDRRPDPSGGAPLDNEAYGFDDFVIGEINQVDGPLSAALSGPVWDEPGWRLLSTPLRGVTVDSLARLNLVQGVPAGDGAVQGQYPDAGSNFYWAYQGGTRWDYVPVPTTGTALRPGRGFWWYWYDRDITPDPTGAGGGTSVSVRLDDFELRALGSELRGTFSEKFEDNTNCASDLASCPAGFTTPNGDPVLAGAPEGTVMPNDDDFYMVGNPYPRPFLVSSISATGGTLQDAMFAWNPGRQDGTAPRTGEDPGLDGPGSYEILFQTPLPGEQAAAAVWQGLLAEVTKTSGEVGNPVTFTYDQAGSIGAGSPPFHGLTAGGPTGTAAKNDLVGSVSSERFLHLTLTGTTASDRQIWDDITYVRFRDDASDGWDRYDASKPVSIESGTSLAVLGERDGETRTQAVLSLSATDRPDQRRWAVVNLAFTAEEAGSYTLSWSGAYGKGHLFDREAGEAVRIHRDSSYTFASEAGEWDSRFVVVFFPPDADDATGAKQEDALSATFIGEPMPNPTVGTFRLDVQLEQAAEATVSVYDALGRRVRVLRVGAEEAGQGTLVTVPANDLAPGAYVVAVEAPGVRETRRVTVIR